jgi:amidohydrolase
VSRMNADSSAAALTSDRSYQGIRDPAQPSRRKNEIAQRHRPGARLSKLLPADRDQVETVTSALSVPAKSEGSGSPGEPAGSGTTAGVPARRKRPLRAAPTSWAEPLPGTDPLPGQLDRWLSAKGPGLVEVRRHIHAHPELSGQEFETAAYVARQLVRAGLTPRFLPKGNGVMCDIGEGDRVVALRADLDALPLPDTKDVPYRSVVDGACHACGHDVHTTILLGTGLALAQLAEQGELPGRVRLLFQPSEEHFPSGAPEVIAAGGLKDVTSVFGLHCAPQLATGKLGVRSGPLTAAADVVEIRVSGPGGHTARPHMTADLVYALSRAVVEVPALLARRVDPRAAVSLMFGALNAGTAANAIPIEGSAKGTVRVLSKDAWADLPDLVPSLIRDVISGTGAEVDITYTRGVPPVINDRMATAIVAGAAAAALGTDRVVEADVSMGGEDFAFYLEQVPGAMVRLGTGIEGAVDSFDIHQSRFDVDERAIGYGIRVMVHTALAALATGSL